MNAQVSMQHRMALKRCRTHCLLHSRSHLGQFIGDCLMDRVLDLFVVLDVGWDIKLIVAKNGLFGKYEYQEFSGNRTNERKFCIP